MTAADPATTVATSAGPLAVIWGINQWVLVDLRGKSLQRRVGSRRELTRLLTDAGLGPEEAQRLAASLWHERPRDAAMEALRPGQEMWRATGLPAWAILLILLLLIAVFVMSRVLHLRG
jgi:hypothetical protein